MRRRTELILACLCILLTLLLVAALKTTDVRINERTGTEIGLYSLNEDFYQAVGSSKTAWLLSDFLICVSIVVIIAFAVDGFIQLVTRKNLLKVDKGILWLAVVYVLDIVIYEFFEHFIINMRPAELAASFPSSHTLLSCTVFGTAGIEIKRLVKPKSVGRILQIICALCAMTTIITRALSGQHWLTDIIGSILISMSITALYHYFTSTSDSEPIE